MGAVVHRPREGEALFGGRIVIKAGFEQLCVTESHFADARPGAGPHLHRRHVDSFYVLEGELAFLVDDAEHPIGPGACVCAPPGLVHGFRSTSRARFLNVHTPDGGFASNLRERDRGEPGGFDSFDVPPATGVPGIGAVLLGNGEGEQLEGNRYVATIKLGREELSLVELELEPGFTGREPHAHDDHADSFYVLEGEARFLVDGEELLLGPGSFVAVPPGVVHGLAAGAERSRLLNVHAPSAGFLERLRQS